MSSTYTTAAEEEGEIMAAVDPETRDGQFMIADITRDDAWLSVPLADAVRLTERR